MFTEFYAIAGTGSNLNAGSTTSATAAYTATNGGWDSGTGVFTPASGDPSASVNVGDWASVYLDAATVAVFIGRVTAVNATTVTVSLTAKSGTAPATGATGRTIKVGGAWAGPNGTSSFPLGFVTAAQMDASNNPVRVNLKGTFNITAAMTHNIAGPVRFQGYTTSAGDGGRATIDGGTTGASYIPLTLGASATNTDLQDLIVQNNGATGTAAGLTVSGADISLCGVVVNSVRGSGFSIGAVQCAVMECEAYSCNQSNTAAQGGFLVAGAGSALVRCFAHDNSGSNNIGIRVSSAGSTVQSCVADTNGKYGIEYSGTGPCQIFDCSVYNNGADGIAVSTASAVTVVVENCILTKNVGHAFELTGAVRNGRIANCAFGAGTQANGGTINNLSGVLEVGTITLATDLDPFSAASTGNFNVTAATVKGTGRGTFTQTQASYTGTVSYPDVGAAQHQEAAASGGLMRNPSLTGGMV